jgi:PAS domain S-box-containing protein
MQINVPKIHSIFQELIPNTLIINSEGNVIWISNALKSFLGFSEYESIEHWNSLFPAEVMRKMQDLKTICFTQNIAILSDFIPFKAQDKVFDILMEKMELNGESLYRIEWKESKYENANNWKLLQRENQILRQTNKELAAINEELHKENLLKEKEIEKVIWENEYLLQTREKQEGLDLAVISAEKHLVKSELNESKKRLELALDAGQLGIWDWNIETNAVIFNKRWAEMLGYELSEIGSDVNTFFDLIHPEDAPLMNELVQKHLNGEIPYFENELRLKGKDGNYHWVYDRGMVVSRDPKGKALRALGIHVYVNDHKRTSQALSESEYKFRNIFNFNTIGIIVADTKGNILDANPKVLEILGYSLAELRGLRPIDFSHPDDLAQERELATEMLSSGADFFRMEKRYIRKDKKIIWANFSLTIIKDENKQFQMALALMEDITEKKNAEEQLRKQNEVLLKVNEELNNFVYRTSHDLRAPLTSLMGLVNITEMADNEVERAQYLKMMSSQLNYLDGVIKEIIDYRKISAGEIRLSEISLKDKIEAVMQHYQFLPNYASISKQIKVQENALFTSDETKINIILNNLVSNAIKYSDKSKTNSFIHIDIQVDTEKAVVEIRDNGIGIPAQHVSSIFKMFFRASVQQNGTGLGLYIVKEALDKLNATIEVESIENEGTTFRVFIPNMH